MAGLAVELAALPPEEAIAYFRGKELLESFSWEDVWQEEHARAFTVATSSSRACRWSGTAPTPTG